MTGVLWLKVVLNPFHWAIFLQVVIGKGLGLLIWFMKCISDLHAQSPFNCKINVATAQITL